MGLEIIVISGFRNNRGQKSAGLVISEPRNNSSSNLSELGIFDFCILPRTKYHMSPVPTLYLVWFLSAVHVTHHPQQRITNTHTTARRACCVRDRASSSHTNATAAAAPPSKPPQQHDTSTTAAAQQQRQQQRRWWPNVAGDNVRARFQKYRQTAKQDLPIQHKTTFQKSEAIMDASYFWCSYFGSLKTTKLIARNNRSKFFHNRSKSGEKGCVQIIGEEPKDTRNGLWWSRAVTLLVLRLLSILLYFSRRNYSIHRYTAVAYG